MSISRPLVQQFCFSHHFIMQSINKLLIYLLLMLENWYLDECQISSFYIHLNTLTLHKVLESSVSFQLTLGKRQVCTLHRSSVFSITRHQIYYYPSTSKTKYGSVQQLTDECVFLGARGRLD